MNRVARWGLVAALGLGAASVATLYANDASADRAKAAGRGKASAPAASLDPPAVKNRTGIEIKPTGLQWGMTEAQLVTFYDRVIDRSYAPLYKKAQAGPQMARLDAAVSNAKAAFRRSKVEFGHLPTGVDSTPLKGEYTYRNGEAMMSINRGGAGIRYFFLIQNKLWKIYDEIPLGDQRPLGPSFEEAIKRMAVQYGVVGRVTQPNFEASRYFMEVDWQDPKTHARVIDRSGTKVVGVVFEDRATLANLASMRTAKVEDPGKVDPEVEALMRPPSAPVGPTEENKQNKPKR
ncbi:MAG: hypothetical protein MUF54_02250 [Polyangiaceae bacterium]|nr:hypothetical protein [Polyangiaceae bacterium]